MRYLLHLQKKFLPILLLFAVSNGFSQAQIATIGNGNITWVNFNPITVGAFRGAGNVHVQMVYTAAEINAAGVTGPRLLDSIAFDVTELPSKALTNYSVKAKNTFFSSLDSFVSTNLTTVANLPSFMPVKGWSWIKFQTPFYWNGVDNLLLDFCSDTMRGTGITGKINVEFPDEGPNVWYSANGATPLCGVYTGGFGSPSKANMKLSFRSAPACSGTPVAGIITPGGPMTSCANMQVYMELVNAPQANVGIQWQQSVEGGAWTNATSKGTGYTATVLASASYIDYRVQMTCVSSGQSSLSNVVRINRNANPAYASLPYSQDFENWISKCATNEIPDTFWAAYPPSGIASWRREDQGASAGWIDDVDPYYYAPASSSGSHSARFQSSKEPGNGSLNLFLNCEGQGLNELRFDYYNKTSQGMSFMYVLLSKDDGATFDTLASLDAMGVRSEWQPQVIPFTSTSAKTIVRFEGYSDVYQSGDFDLGIDNLRVYPTCTEKPVAGSVDSLSACKGQGLTLSLSGNSKSGGLTWLWQQTTDGIRWENVAGGDIEHPNTPLNEDTWFRCIVTCTNSGISDTTAPRLIPVKPFYNCYCASSSTVASTFINIGNVKILTEPAGTVLLDNGNPLPATGNPEAKKHYSDYTNLAVTDLFRDSSYKFNLTFFTHNGKNVSPIMGGAYSEVYIDYNRNGVFDDDEMVFHHYKEEMVYSDSFLFTVPKTAAIGVTGLRIVTNDTWDSTEIAACGPYSYGETEDYLVRINNLPCNGTEETGFVLTTDTSLCPGYPFVLTNSGADSTSGLISTVWQHSANGTAWSDIAGTEGNHVMSDTFDNPGFYRVKFECGRNNLAFYSDSIAISKDPLCYCASYATGGFAGLADSSDFGSFKLGSINLPLSGGHLNNGLAIQKYSDYTYLPAPELYADSTYQFTLDHTILRNSHADARITLFIDYNGNGNFDLPAEGVYTGISAATTWHKVESLTIPSDVVLGKETGMRLIINNDTAANIPSDEACGTYVSGHTMDFRLLFRKAEPEVGIEAIGTANWTISLYPNPSTGLIALRHSASAPKSGYLTIENVAGQVIQKQDFDHWAQGDIINVDLRNYSKGLYFINIESGNERITRKVVIQ